MSKYDVKSVVCDYGVFENNKLKIIVNSQANALLIKYILEQDSQHKVVIPDLLEKISKKKRKFKAMTVGEWCDPSKCSQCEYHYNLYFCSYAEFNRVNRALEKDKPYKTKNGKYILIEVKE
jgi:hypothetical protein